MKKYKFLVTQILSGLLGAGALLSSCQPVKKAPKADQTVQTAPLPVTHIKFYSEIDGDTTDERAFAQMVAKDSNPNKLVMIEIPSHRLPLFQVFNAGADEAVTLYNVTYPSRDEAIQRHGAALIYESFYKQKKWQDPVFRDAGFIEPKTPSEFQAETNKLMQAYQGRMDPTLLQTAFMLDMLTMGYTKSDQHYPNICPNLEFFNQRQAFLLTHFKQTLELESPTAPVVHNNLVDFSAFRQMMFSLREEAHAKVFPVDNPHAMVWQGVGKHGRPQNMAFPWNADSLTSEKFLFTPLSEADAKARRTTMDNPVVAENIKAMIQQYGKPDGDVFVYYGSEHFRDQLSANSTAIEKNTYDHRLQNYLKDYDLQVPQIYDPKSRSFHPAKSQGKN